MKAASSNQSNSIPAAAPVLPAEGFVRAEQIANNPKKGTYGIIPISLSSWWEGVKAGIYPKPVKLGGARAVGWRVEDIRDLIERLSNQTDEA